MTSEEQSERVPASSHTDEHEERLVGYLSGADPHDAFASSDLSGCASCRELYGVYSQLGDALDATGQDMAETLESSEQWAGAPGEDQVARIIRDQVAGSGLTVTSVDDSEGGLASERFSVAGSETIDTSSGSGKPGPIVKSPYFMIAAAAAVLLIGLATKHWWPTEDSPGIDPSIQLGDSERIATYPVGEVKSFDRFEWQGLLPDHGWYHLKVVGPDGTVLIEEEDLEESSFDASALSEVWPETIRWEVSFLGPSGAWIETVYAEARRRP